MFKHYCFCSLTIIFIWNDPPLPLKNQKFGNNAGGGGRETWSVPYFVCLLPRRGSPEGQPNKVDHVTPWYHSHVCSLSCSFLAALCVFLRFPKLRQGRIDSQLDLTVVWLPERQINTLQVSLGCCQCSVWVPITTNQEFAKHLLQYLHMN